VSLLSVVLKSESVYSLRALSSGTFHCKPSVQRGQEDCERLQASHRVLTVRGRSRRSFPCRTISAFSAVSPPRDQLRDRQAGPAARTATVPYVTSFPESFRDCTACAFSLLVSLPRVYPPSLSSTSAKQRIRVACVGVMRVTGKYLTALTLPG
jgi:hypothetical protein